MNRKEYNKKFRKFTDKEFLGLYNRGLGDTQISKIFKCSSSTVYLRRRKFGLVSNIPRRSGENLTEKELLESYKNQLTIRDDLGKRKFKNDEDYRKYQTDKAREWQRDNPKKISKSNRRKNRVFNCIDCNKKIWRPSLKCKKCSDKYRREKSQNFCLDCNKKISKRAKRCYSCSRKFLKKPFKKNKRWMYTEYITKKRSLKNIGNELNLSVQTIANWLERYKIKRRRRGRDYKTGGN